MKRIEFFFVIDFLIYPCFGVIVADTLSMSIMFTAGDLGTHRVDIFHAKSDFPCSMH